MRPGQRLAAVIAAGVLPWVVVGSGTSISLVASYGLVGPATGHVTPVWIYVFELTRGSPGSLLAWPIATLLYGAALANAIADAWGGREDSRLTGGLLVLVGGCLVAVALTVGRSNGVIAVPIGTAAVWGVAWWGYRDGLMGMFQPSSDTPRR